MIKCHCTQVNVDVQFTLLAYSCAMYVASIPCIDTTFKGKGGGGGACSK